jgi:hypothetical protein
MVSILYFWAPNFFFSWVSFFDISGSWLKKRLVTRIDADLPKQVKRLKGDPEKPISTLIEQVLVE